MRRRAERAGGLLRRGGHDRGQEHGPSPLASQLGTNVCLNSPWAGLQPAQPAAAFFPDDPTKTVKERHEELMRKVTYNDAVRRKVRNERNFNLALTTIAVLSFASVIRNGLEQTLHWTAGLSILAIVVAATLHPFADACENHNLRLTSLTLLSLATPVLFVSGLVYFYLVFEVDLVELPGMRPRKNPPRPRRRYKSHKSSQRV